MTVCSNCGKTGHFFRDCKEPTTSLGILAYRITSDLIIQWLMVRRRVSIGFIELMRGKYELRDSANIQSLVNQTTISERQQLLTCTFPNLWLSLWNGKATERYQREYEQSCAKFEILRSRPIQGLAELCANSTTSWTEPEWGFPKGRRSLKESDLSCALRETHEEAGIKPRLLRIVSPEKAPLIEEYRGSNGVCYRYRYWIAEAPPDLSVSLDSTNEDQIREISDVRWFSLEDAIAAIRPYSVEKIAVLRTAASFITKL